jgi:hypothetical protein
LPGSPRLPVVGAHVTPPEGGSPVGGHGDVFSGGSPWTVTDPLFDLHDLLVLCRSFVRSMFKLHKFGRRPPRTQG